MSSSCSRPTRAPTFDFGTVVILSTMKAAGRTQSVLLIRFYSDSKQRRLGVIRSKGTNSDGVCGIEAVILQDRNRARLACIALTAGHRPNVAPPHSSSQFEMALMNA